MCKCIIIIITCHLKAWFSDPNRLKNCKIKMFKIFEIRPRSCDDVIINIITILNINKYIKLIKLKI